MNILLIDNFDSFTYNLYQYIGALKGNNVIVKRSDEISLNDINKIYPDKIIISPGPGKPEDALLSVEVIKELGGKIPILGVCLGHQVIAFAYGANVVKSDIPVHGKTVMIHHDGKSIYRNIPQNIEVMRYHSLEVVKESIPDCLHVSSVSEDGNIVMGLRHKDLPIEGVQFHPESILTDYGAMMIENWVNEK